MWNSERTNTLARQAEGGITLTAENKHDDKLTCLDWLSFCQAECCRKFYIAKEGVDLIIGKHELRIKLPLNADMARYYRYHGCKYVGGRLIIPFNPFELAYTDDKVVVHKRCSHLMANNLCDLHNSGLKPEVCRRFDEQGSINQEGCISPEKCLTRYK
jgi:hypothetical protein